MKSIYDWNNEYGLYHQNKTNKIIHWICVPLIMFSLFGLLSFLNFSFSINTGNYQISILGISIILVLIFYLKLSKSLAIGMLFISMILYGIVYELSMLHYFVWHKANLLYFYILIFILSWIGQFIGHKIEGKKPAFFKDLQFLLIGPVWLLSFIYNKLNIKI